MSSKRIKQVLAVVVLIATVSAFVYYLKNHPESLLQLRKVPLHTLLLLLFLYGLFLVALTWIQRATLTLCDIKLGRKESILLVSYSSIINFFGPLQSGPAFRAAYLKRKHDVKLKNYAVATLLYYGFYAAFSGLFILTYFIGLWALIGVIVVIGMAPFVLRSPKFLSLIPPKFRDLKLQHVGTLAVATLAQVSVMAIIYFVELSSLGQSVKFVPALIYTGAANFALFVSFTPGAIGFREAFLLFSQHLHQISSGHIASASLIDRGVYIVFLGLLAALVFGLHAQNYLQPKDKTPGETSDTYGKPKQPLTNKPVDL